MTHAATRSRTRLSAGVLSADLTRLGEQLAALEGTDAWAHVDVMDGRFCPSLTAGTPLIRAVAACGAVPDAHLMVEEPRRLLPEVVAAGAGVVTVHVESTRHLHRTMLDLTDLAADRSGLVRGIALNPGTPVTAIEPVLHLADLVLVLAVDPGWSGQAPAATTARRVEAVRELAERTGGDVLVGVDGGVTIDNVTTVAAMRPDVVVAGSAVFSSGDPRSNVDTILSALNGRSPR